jgi:hypothetical protein
MAFSLESLVGKWEASSRLYLGPDTTFDSSSTMEVAASPVSDRFYDFAYTWSHEGKTNRGRMTAAQDSKSGLNTAAWMDSWHQSAQVMFLKGATVEDRFTAVGDFAAGEEVWHWRFSAIPQGADEFRWVMHVISPDGKQDDLAVDAVYRRIK